MSALTMTTVDSQALYWEYPRSMPCATESQISRKPSLAPVELAASGR